MKELKGARSMVEEQRIPKIGELVIFEVDGEIHRVLDVSYNTAWEPEEDGPFLKLYGIDDYVSHKLCETLS